MMSCRHVIRVLHCAGKCGTGLVPVQRVIGNRRHYRRFRRIRLAQILDREYATMPSGRTPEG